MELANRRSVPDLDPGQRLGMAPQRQQKRVSMDQLTAARPCATIWLECEQDFDRRALILRWDWTLSDSFLNNLRLTNTAGKSFSKSLASECFRDEINEDPRLRRH
jgi:hypothetical protein